MRLGMLALLLGLPGLDAPAASQPQDTGSRAKTKRRTPPSRVFAGWGPGPFMRPRSQKKRRRLARQAGR